MHNTNVPPVFDGQSATTMDEALLRDEPMLDQYWSAVGWLSYAKCKLAVSDIKSSLQARQLLLMNHMSTQAVEAATLWTSRAMRVMLLVSCLTC